MGEKVKFFSRKPKDNRENQLLKSLCLGMVGDFSKLLDDKGFDKPVNKLEIIIFSMFIINETYFLANKGCANTSLDAFRLEMLKYAIDLRKTIPEDEHEPLINGLNEYVVDAQFAMYKQCLWEDLNNPATIYTKTISAFIDHLFTEPISENEKQNILIPMALNFAKFYRTSLQTLQIKIC